MNSSEPPQPDSFGTDNPNAEIDSEEFEYTETKLDKSSTKERIGRDIYTSESQSFEEMFSNGMTAIREAVDRDYFEIEDGRIEIELIRNESGNVCMRFRDNGIGMSEDIVKDVFLNFGITTGSLKDDMVAKFGMGVASYPNLVGFHDGRIYMETNCRYSDDAIYGYYTIDGLSHNNDVDNLRLLGPDTFGTAYEMWLKDDITLTDIKGWVEDVAQYSRITVELTNPDGSTTVYEPSTVYDKFDVDENMFIEYEDEEIGKFVAGHNVPDDAVLIHRIVDYSSKSAEKKPPFRSNVFIHLYTESEKVCEGEYKGLIVIEDHKYEALSPEMKERHVPASDVPNNVPITPRIVGNREELADNNGFWDWVVEKLRQTHFERVKNCVEPIESSEDFFNLGLKDRNYVKFALTQTAFSRSYKYRRFSQNLRPKLPTTKVQEIINEQTPTEYELSEEKAKVLSALFDSDVIQDSSVEQSNRGHRTEYVRRQRGTTVYMGVSINAKKKRVVKDDDSNSIIVKVKNAGAYDLYEEVFGWEKLKQVKKSTLDQFDITEETKNLFGKTKKEVKGESAVSAETLTIHFGRREPNKSKVTADFVHEAFKEDDADARLMGTPIVAFPPDTDYNISDFYDYTKKSRNKGNSAGLFNCSKTTWKDLKDFDGVLHVEDILRQHKSITEVSSTGEMNVFEALDNKEVCVIVMSSSDLNTYLNYFTHRDVCDRFKHIINNNKIAQYSLGPIEDGYEVMVTSARKLLNNHFVFYGTKAPNLYYLHNDSIPSKYAGSSKLERNNDIQMIGALALAEWSDTDMYDALTNNVRFSNFSDPASVIAGFRRSFQGGTLNNPPLLDDIDEPLN